MTTRCNKDTTGPMLEDRRRRYPIPLLIAKPDGEARSAADRRRASGSERAGDSRTVTIALVNNMPDAAFDQTARQFATLLDGASGEITVELRRYALPGLCRSDGVRTQVSECYFDFDHLMRDPPDALVVTGTEPLAADLTAEPYFRPLADLICWAETATVSAVLSCLAAHAAVLIFDGIERRPLPEKCSGVFEHAPRGSHPIVAGLSDPVAVPHSRLNDIPAEQLEQRGYLSLLSSRSVGWTLLTKERGRCLVLLVQGHPEYSTTSLLREYARDLRRYLEGERDTIPAVPVGYLDPEATTLLEEFHAEAWTGHRSEAAMARFPFDELSRHLSNTWRQPGEQLYANWLREVFARRHGPASGAA